MGLSQPANLIADRSGYLWPLRCIGSSHHSHDCAPQRQFVVQSSSRPRLRGIAPLIQVDTSRICCRTCEGTIRSSKRIRAWLVYRISPRKNEHLTPKPSCRNKRAGYGLGQWRVATSLFFRTLLVVHPAIVALQFDLPAAILLHSLPCMDLIHRHYCFLVKPVSPLSSMNTVQAILSPQKGETFSPRNAGTRSGLPRGSIQIHLQFICDSWSEYQSTPLC